MSGGYPGPGSTSAYGQQGGAKKTYGYTPYAQADSPDPLQLGGGQGPEYDPVAARGAYAEGSAAQGGHSAVSAPPSNDPLHGGYAQPGGQSYGEFAAGGAGGGSTSDGARVGSVNYGAVGNLQSLVANDPQAAAQLRAMGLMPTVNGIAVDQGSPGANGGVGRSYVGGGTMPSCDAHGNYIQPDGSIIASDGRTPLAGPGGAPLGGGAGGGGSGATAPGTGLPLEGQIEGGYSSLIANHGHVLNPLDEASLVNQGQDAIAHGQKDALGQARLDAIRRGDTSGSTLGSREDDIRMSGSAAQAKSAIGTRTALDNDAGNRMLGALGGATGMYGQELGNVESLRQLALLQGQQGQGNIQALMNLR